MTILQGQRAYRAFTASVTAFVVAFFGLVLPLTHAAGHLGQQTPDAAQGFHAPASADAASLAYVSADTAEKEHSCAYCLLSGALASSTLCAHALLCLLPPTVALAPAEFGSGPAFTADLCLLYSARAPPVF